MADFSARFASRRVGAYRTLLYMQFFGFIALTIFLKFTGGFGFAIAPGWRPWMMTVVAGVLNVTASLSLYYSFEIGVMSIVGPVSSCYPVLTVVLSFLSGERIGIMRGFGLGVTVMGVVLASTSFAENGKEASRLDVEHHQHKAHLSRGVGWAIGAAIGFGILFWLLGFYVVPAVGSGISVWVMRLTAIASLLLVAIPAGKDAQLPHGLVWWIIAATGLLDTAAFVFNNAGLHVGPVSVVSVLASLYGAVTVVLSWIFLRERLEWSQWLGIVLIFAGILMVSL